MTDTFLLPSLYPALPEILLAAGAMVLLMVGAFRGDAATTAVNVAAVVLLLVAGILVVNVPGSVGFGGSFVVDAFARFLKVLALLGSAVAIILSTEFFGHASRRRF